MDTTGNTRLQKRWFVNAQTLTLMSFSSNCVVWVILEPSIRLLQLCCLQQLITVRQILFPASEQ